MSSNSVAASPLIERNSVVSYVEDLGTTATFKQASLLELTDDLIIFPNPASEREGNEPSLVISCKSSF